MKAKLYILTIGLLVGLSSSCTKEHSQEIEAELLVYFDAFVEEATTHGVEITLEDLDIGGYVENIEQRGTLGQCKSYSNGSKAIVVDISYWERANDLEREYLVFHELGHCILNREHEDSRDEGGICTSIMQSGTHECRGAYTLENRNALLRELFGT